MKLLSFKNIFLATLVSLSFNGGILFAQKNMNLFHVENAVKKRSLKDYEGALKEIGTTPDIRRSKLKRLLKVKEMIRFMDQQHTMDKIQSEEVMITIAYMEVMMLINYMVMKEMM